MFGDTPLVMIEDAEALAGLVDRLSRAPVIGVDTESDSFHHYREKVCLIQFSDADADYIVDPLAIEDISSLGPIFADPDIVKVLHGADYDIVCLKRDFGFQINNLFETLIAAQLLGLERIGLADLLDRWFGVTVDKQYQRHDWAARPLRQEHLEYARGDTHFLLALRELFLRKLKGAGRLRHHIEECGILERREWTGTTAFDPDGYLDMKKAGTLDDVGKRVLRRLWLYRDEQARNLDRPPFKVFGNQVMLDLASKRPRTEKAFNALFPKQAAMKRRFGKKMVECVVLGMEDDFPIPKPPKKRRSRSSGPRLTGRTAERALSELKAWRNKLVDETAHTPFTVASNNTLKNIAHARPRSLDELASINEVRAWQVDEFGEEILAVLDRAVP